MIEVTYVDHMGSDLSVVNAARVSFNKKSDWLPRVHNGEKKTLGIMMPGDYRFTTEKKELMEIQSGEVDVRLDGSNDWQCYANDTSFEVPANSAFDIAVVIPSAVVKLNETRSSFG